MEVDIMFIDKSSITIDASTLSKLDMDQMPALLTTIEMSLSLTSLTMHL
jgi:hypothetical protein